MGISKVWFIARAAHGGGQLARDPVLIAPVPVFLADLPAR